LDERRTNAPGFVLGFVDGISTCCHDPGEVFIAIGTGEGDRREDILLDVVDDELSVTKDEQRHLMVFSFGLRIPHRAKPFDRSRSAT
jgi:hypothetical protein